MQTSRCCFRQLWHVLGLLSVLVLSGCAGVSTTKTEESVFYPALPTPPRIQYLARFSSSNDLAADNSSFKQFVVGKESSSSHLVQKPYGVAVHEGKIYVVDTRGSGYGIFDLKNNRTDFIHGFGGGKMDKPINITIDTNGTKYITDTERNKVLVFDKNDQFVRAYGRKDQFKPIDVAVINNRLYISDLYHHRIVVLDKDTGKTLFTFGTPGSKEGELFQPTNLTLSADKHLYISDTGNFRIQKYTLDGKFVRTYGSIGATVGKFARPKGISVDKTGRLFIIDAAFENIQIMDKTGTPLMFFAGPGDKTGNINLPTDIVIDYDNVKYFQKYADPKFKLEYIVLVASQFGINKVTVFGFGKMQGMDYSAPKPE
ncbi:MAG: hypothetical protein OEW89_01535 [Gammaproteobacteria bacterium]|nr:hypothetical protein [Gammaproteobacteria bacterium]MDH5592920.1 hypothetical protein [Gammaproteobacteria bacterium]